MNGGLSNRTKGTLCLIVSAFGFAMMGMFVRLTDDLGGPISCFQKGFFRNAVAVVIAAGLFWSRDLKGRASGRLQHQDSRFSKISSPTHLPTWFPKQGHAKFWKMRFKPLGEVFLMVETLVDQPGFLEIS